MAPREIGQRIKARLDYLDETQAWLAKEFGCQPGTMSNYISGERELSSTDMKRLAELLGVPVAYFYGEDAPQEDENLAQLTAAYNDIEADAQDILVSVAKSLVQQKRRAEQVHGRKALTDEEAVTQQ